MSRRTKIIIAAIAILLMLLLAALLLTGGTAEEATVLSIPTGSTGKAGLEVINGTISINSAGVNQAPAPAPVPAAKPDPGTNPRQLAKSFAERYGSFSSQSDFENLLDLKVFMSAAMAARTDAYVAAESQKPPSQFYFGTTTRSINAELTAFDDQGGTATVMVKTQRQEFKDTTGKPDVFYQDVIIGLVREDGVWKVDSATWQPK